MSRIEGYLADLGNALGDRLPPSVHQARLREARAHLLDSTQDVGEAEAIRRYGRPRRVANDLVRIHRGYLTKSAWRLALPVSAAFLVAGIGSSIYARLTPGSVGPELWMLVWSFTILAFIGRVVQTRRWLAGPMLATHGLAVGLILLSSHLVGKDRWGFDEIGLLCLYLVVFGSAWFALNALALGIGRVLDLRGVRRGWRAS